MEDIIYEYSKSFKLYDLSSNVECRLTGSNFRKVLVLSITINDTRNGNDIHVYVNGMHIQTLSVAQFLPVKFNMDTQPDRSSVEYLNVEYR